MKFNLIYLLVDFYNLSLNSYLSSTDLIILLYILVQYCALLNILLLNFHLVSRNHLQHLSITTLLSRTQTSQLQKVCLLIVLNLHYPFNRLLTLLQWFSLLLLDLQVFNYCQFMKWQWHLCIWMYDSVVCNDSWLFIVWLIFLLLGLLCRRLPYIDIVGRVQLNLMSNFYHNCILVIT